jgi:L-alanine-DL-glutamate epimerase-like enolase superfamily enzyme
MAAARIERVPVYFTYVWPPVPEDQVPPREQGLQAARLRALGFKAMKIQIMRTDYHGDVEAVREMLAQGGEGFRAMVTAPPAPGDCGPTTVAGDCARLQAAGCYWLEEPWRVMTAGPARLCREVDMLITGRSLEGVRPVSQGT